MRRRRDVRNKAATLKPKETSAMMFCGSTWPVSSLIGYTFEARKAQGKNASNRTVKTLTWKSWSPSKLHEAKGSSFNDWNSAIASGASIWSICMSRLFMPFATLLFSISAAEDFCAHDAPKQRAALAARKAVAPWARQPLRKRPVCKRPLGWWAATLTDTRTEAGNVAMRKWWAVVEGLCPSFGLMLA